MHTVDDPEDMMGGPHLIGLPLDRMRIIPVETGRKPYFVLQNKKGVPIAQGRLQFCAATYRSIYFGDTREQARDRLIFWQVTGTQPHNKPSRRTGGAT